MKGLMADSDDAKLEINWVLNNSDQTDLLDMAEIRRLRSAAREARLNAHAIASGFRVGAALLTETGEIYTGCNVEASNGSSICAERTALVKAISDGRRAFVAVCAIGDTDVPITPCGQCRQHLSDLAPQLLVLMATIRAPVIEAVRLDTLFPRANFRTGSSTRPRHALPTT